MSKKIDFSSVLDEIIENDKRTANQSNTQYTKQDNLLLTASIVYLAKVLEKFVESKNNEKEL